ncbi:unnamed protein product [Linum trigynum]|uniref:Uncharacterized protein n=1 Tax=Linum trigynum TaxID=586398 RepID=A0AAV2CG79_9ROSI
MHIRTRNSNNRPNNRTTSTLPLISHPTTSSATSNNIRRHRSNIPSRGICRGWRFREGESGDFLGGLQQHPPALVQSSSSACSLRPNPPSSNPPAPPYKTQPPRIHLLFPTKSRDSTYSISEQAGSNGSNINVGKKEEDEKGKLEF